MRQDGRQIAAGRDRMPVEGSVRNLSRSAVECGDGKIRRLARLRYGRSARLIAGAVVTAGARRGSPRQRTGEAGRGCRYQEECDHDGDADDNAAHGYCFCRWHLHCQSPVQIRFMNLAGSADRGARFLLGDIALSAVHSAAEMVLIAMPARPPLSNSTPVTFTFFSINGMSRVF